MEIINCIKTLPWHPTRIWGVRSLDVIDKIIIHQELGEGDVASVNNYHIHPNHISAKGCPHFCYHYGIEKDGTIKQANELSSVTWHTKGENTKGVSIMLVGNFNGTGYNMGTEGPTEAQMDSLSWLVQHLQSSLGLNNQDVFGHYHFGKPVCPGYKASEWIENLRDEADTESATPAPSQMGLRELQGRLLQLGLYTGKVDNIMGPLTRAAIFKFQQNTGLMVDGVAGPQTKRKLIELTPNFGG